MPENIRNRIALNVTSSVVQVIITGIVYFFIYRMLVIRHGVEVLGVWSLVTASASIANLSNFGFTSAIVKFVAEYDAKNEPGRIHRLLHTSIASILSLFVLIAIIIYAGASVFFDKLIDQQYVELGLLILPIILTGLLLNSAVNVITSALEGFQKNYIRNFASSVASLGYLLLAIFLIPEFGLIGLALAQVLQAAVIFLISDYFLKRTGSGFSILKPGWDRESFKILMGYGYKIQAISIFQLLTDPVTKILVGRFHGITTLGFYEMASRVINQLRQIIAGMDQVSVPIVSHFQQTDKTTIKYIYERGLSFVIFIVFPLFAGIVLFTPYLSKIWIGSIEPVFINCTYILAAGMLLNILNAQAYFNSLGEGHLNGILYMTFFVLVFNTLLGIVLGMTFNIYGVVTANSVSAALGSLFLVYYYQKNNRIRLMDILKISDYLTVICGLLFAFLSFFLLINIGEKHNYNLKSMFCFLVLYAIFFIPVAYYNRNFKLLNIFQYFKK